MQIIDISGQRFGNVIALEYAYTKSNKRFYKCKCDCGNNAFISRKLLVNGDTKSCGCKWRISNKAHGSWKGYEEIPKDFFSNLKRGAQSRNIEFNIEIEDLWELLLKQNRKCALSGLELTFSKIRKDNKSKTISLDRIDSSKDYVKSNIQFVHKHVNIMKNKFDESYFIELCENIVNQNKLKNELE
jgi:hypothetical protein